MEEAAVGVAEEVYTPVMENLADALTLKDRCDACGAAAKSIVLLESGGSELMFCKHHLQRHEPALVASGARVFVQQDEAQKLEEAAAVE